MDPVQEEGSLPSGQAVLGVPISPGFGGVMREEYKHGPEDSAIEDEDEYPVHVDEGPTTPKPRHSILLQTPQTPQTPRALFFRPTASSRAGIMNTPPSPIHRPSFSSFDHSSFPHPPSASPGIRPPRSSMMSFHPSMALPLSPPYLGEHRSRVSLDAIPLMPPMELAPKDGEEEAGEHHEEEGTICGTPTTSVHTHRHTPRSVSSPTPNQNTTPVEPSFNFSFLRDTDPGTSKKPSQAADQTIRSAQGVVSLGEGWSSEPRPRPSRLSWFSRRKKVVTADPLMLRGEGDGDAGEGLQRSTSVSPLRQMWNRSKRNLFGESCPSLPDQRPITPVHQVSARVHLLSPGELRRWSTLGPNSTPPPPDSDPFLRHEPGVTSSHSSTNPIRPLTSTFSFSPSSPHLPLRPNSQHSPSYRSYAFARSEGDLHSLGSQRGLPPPWRPRSMLVTGGQRSLSQNIPELDEGRPGESSSGSPTYKPKRGVSWQASEHSPRSGGTAAAILPPITRTETFGNGSSEEYHGPRGELEHDVEAVHDDKMGRAMPEKSRGDKSGTRPPSPSFNRGATPWENRASIFHRMKVMLFHRRGANEAKEKRSKTPVPVKPSVGRRRYFRQALYSRSRATLVQSPSAPVLASSAEPEGDLDDESQYPFPRCRSPWLAFQSSALARRFSMFGEHHERGHEHEEEDSQSTIRGTHTRPSTSRRSSHPTQRRHSTSHTSTHSIHSQRTITNESTSDHLVRLSTADLNLDLHLEGAGLGLDDIIDESRRSSYVSAMYTRGAMSLNDLTAIGRADTPSFAASGQGIGGWMGAPHKKDSLPRASSVQGDLGLGRRWKSCYARSYDALALGPPISAAPLSPAPITEYSYSGGSESRSLVSKLALITPAMQTPRDLDTTALGSITVPEFEEDGGEETKESEGGMGLGMSGTMTELVHKESHLKVESVTSSGESYQSPDDDESFHAHEQHATRFDDPRTCDTKPTWCRIRV